MGSDSSIAICTIGLSKVYDHRVVLDHLSISVSRGKIFGLLGPNGAGKSTAIKICTTLLDATSGSAVVAGYNVATDPFKVRQRIGYVPQLVSADGALTATENLILSASLYGLRGQDRKSRVADSLRFAGLEEMGNRLVKTFSGGMVRRLEIAQATLHQPEVLFLDEPTIGLDPLARRSVWERMLLLRKERGVTVLMTTHDMEEADMLCDEIAILHRGQLAAMGSPAELKAVVGPGATLDEVFIHFSGGKLQEGGSFSEIRANRVTIRRMG